MQFLAQIQGGVGPDVWDREVFIDAPDFIDAACQAGNKANVLDGQVTLLEQCDCSEAEALERAVPRVLVVVRGPCSAKGADARKGLKMELTKAAEDVLAERRRQVEVEGWTPEHDDSHGAGELAIAAACYAGNSAGKWGIATAAWPWAPKWWKPANARRDLVKAGALILAEIERMDRAALPPNE